jgi:hypothetical protein
LGKPHNIKICLFAYQRTLDLYHGLKRPPLTNPETKTIGFYRWTHRLQARPECTVEKRATVKKPARGPKSAPLTVIIQFNFAFYDLPQSSFIFLRSFNIHHFIVPSFFTAPKTVCFIFYPYPSLKNTP